MLEQIKNTNDLEQLQKLFSDAFGKNGTMSSRLKEMKNLSEAERAALNIEKDELQAAFKSRQAEIENEKMLAALSEQKLDASADAPDNDTGGTPGKIHPLTQALSEISAAFESMGYSRADGPEIEDDWHNFTALNTPAYHPAREMQDTFFIEGTKNVMRTQTSAVQIREMERAGAPIKIFVPGMTYRRDMDATHSPQFRQIEGLWVDRGVTLQNLIADIRTFCSLFFGREIEVRLRPSYFPFTEPSVEFDMKWGDNWLEMGGAGMVHPAVLENCKIDPKQFQGFAFGLGWERLAMVKYGVNHIKKFYDGDARWLANEGF
ncbi:MAG: phenylalanine--tRNA ligase subunit alpha [Rickettsiales bacterium]|nr:phenylalanine--tRNA ligase subunit alpha [Rickettsiales bacterium]